MAAHVRAQGVSPDASPVRGAAPSDSTPDAVASPPTADARDAALLGEPATQTPPTLASKESSLSIGGELLWRAAVSAQRGQLARDWQFSSPAILDLFADATPSDDVRIFMRTRTSFDPTRSATAAPTPASGIAPAYALSVPQRGPATVLDQLWLRFTLKNRVFATAGRQHDTWGTGRVWHPSDFLHLAQRNPLEPFDVRSGLSMLRVQVPWQALGSNFYFYGITESQQATESLRHLAGAFRAQFLLGPMELSAGVFGRASERPRYAADVSVGLGPFDVYGEAALRETSSVDRVQKNDAFTLSDPTMLPALEELAEGMFPRYRQGGYHAQLLGGLDCTIPYGDNDSIVFTGEYFYNQLGYATPDAYLGLFLPRIVPLKNAATPFYLGRHYAALSVKADKPFSWDLTSLRLSFLTNASDRSWVGRFDYDLTFLSYLHLEAFVGAHFGRARGEFRAGSSVVSLPLASGGSVPVAELSRAPQIFDVGVGLHANF